MSSDTNTDIERALRDELHQRVADISIPNFAKSFQGRRAGLAPPPRPRGRRVGVLVAAAALVAAAIAVPAIFSVREKAGPAPSATTGPSVSPLKWPTRGSAAGEKAYIEKVENWFAGLYPELKAKPGAFHVVYVGDLGKRRLVITAMPFAPGSKDFRFERFTLPKGSQQLPIAPSGTDSPGSDATAHPVSANFGGIMLLVNLPWLEDSDGTAYLAILSPGVDRLTFSGRPIFRSDGTITRTWQPVKDDDPSDGVVRFTSPGSASWPRVQVVSDEQVVADYTLAPLNLPQPDSILVRMKDLLEVAGKGRQVGRFALALKWVETGPLRGDRIERIESVRITGSTPKNSWISAIVHTADAAFEVHLREDPAKTFPDIDDLAEPIVKIVPKRDASKAVSVWTDGPKCMINGWDPSGRTVTVELSSRGKTYTLPVSSAQSIAADFCEMAGNRSKVEPRARLLDKNGAEIWSGTPFFDDDPSAFNRPVVLDMPITTGDRVD